MYTDFSREMYLTPSRSPSVNVFHARTGQTVSPLLLLPLGNRVEHEGSSPDGSGDLVFPRLNGQLGRIGSEEKT